MSLLIMLVSLGQVGPYRPVVPAYIEPAQVIPANAVTHRLDNGETVAVVPEEPITRTVNFTKMIPSCGMGWCGTHPLVPHVTTRIVCDNAPTPMPALESILRLAGVTKDDVLADLGCGDGRVGIVAAKGLGCQCILLEQRNDALALARRNVVANRVQAKVSVRQSNLAWRDFKEATVVYVYLNPADIAKLKIPSTVRLGISYQYPWPGVKCEQIGKFYVWKRPAAQQTSYQTASCPGGL